MLRIFLLMMATVLGEKSQRVDLIELNHCCAVDQQGFDQVIFYEWSPDYRRFDVIGWKFLRDVDGHVFSDSAPPKFWFRSDGKQVTITGRLFRETFTRRDPERDAKQLMDEDCRNCILRGTQSILER